MIRPTLSLLLLAACLGAARGEMVVLSEIRHRPPAGKPEYLVLTNQTATPFDIANWRFTEGVRFEFPSFNPSAPRESFLRAGERIVISAADPAQTRSAYGVPHDVRVFGPWAGKLKNEGERITLKDKNGVTVCSVAYGAEGMAGTGSTVSRSTQTNVVINEILFAPPPHLPRLEYVELFNRGSNEVDLSGWQLRDAIQFTFPDGTKLAGAGFLVVASDLTQARTVYGDIPVLGNFYGKLGNEGERVRLVDAEGHLVNEVHYRSGGEWTEAVKGGGSSLELVNPWLDNSRSSAWQASDEAGKAPWQTYSATLTYQELKPIGEPRDYKELHLYLVGKGQALLKDIQLLHRGTNVLLHASQLSTNGGGDSGWLCQGTHWASMITNGQLHVVSDGRGDDRANRLEIDVPALQRDETYELRFQARWLGGQPRLLAQTWDRSFTHSFLLEVPPHLGTPGRVNSRFVSVPPPQLDGLRHFPVVPRSTDTVTVSARVLSQGTCAVIRLFHRADNVRGDGAWASEPMFDDGQRGGDLKAGDGIYTGKLDCYRKPGQVVQFYIAAEDGPETILTLPRPGPDRPALFVVDDRTLPRDLRTVRLVLSAQDLDAVAQGGTASHRFRFPRLSNHYFNGTLIFNEGGTFYGAGWRNCGSPLTREGELHKPKVKLPANQPYRGRTKFVYDDDAAEGKAYHNRVARYLLYLLGHVANENEFVRLIINAGPVQLREEVEPVDEGFLARNFAEGRRGELYRIDDTWWLSDAGEGLHEDADWSYRQSDEPGPYRGSWLKRTREAEDDFRRLIEWFKVVSADGHGPARDEEFLDVEAILKLAAVRGFIGDWDNFTMQRGRNGYFYRRPSDGRFQLLHWDSDEGFMTGPPLYGRFLAKWIEEPSHYKVFVHYLKELIALTVEEPARLATWLKLEREAVREEVFQATYLNFFKARAAEVEEMLAGRVARTDAAKTAEKASAE